MYVWITLKCPWILFQSKRVNPAPHRPCLCDCVFTGGLWLARIRKHSCVSLPQDIRGFRSSKYLLFKKVHPRQMQTQWHRQKIFTSLSSLRWKADVCAEDVCAEGVWQRRECRGPNKGTHITESCATLVIMFLLYTRNETKHYVTPEHNGAFRSLFPEKYTIWQNKF